MNITNKHQKRYDILVSLLIVCYVSLSALGIVDYLVGRFRMESTLCLWYIGGPVLFIIWLKTILNILFLKPFSWQRFFIAFFSLLILISVVLFSIHYRISHGFMYSGRVYLQGVARDMEENANLDCIYKWMETNIERAKRIEFSQWPDCIKELKPVCLYVTSEGELNICFRGFPGAIYCVIPKGMEFSVSSDEIPVKGGYIKFDPK